MNLSAAAPAVLDKRQDLRQQIMIYTILFIVTAVGVYLAFLVCGRTFITEGDGKMQQYPFYSMVKRMISGLINGEGFQFWRWEIGLGDDWFAAFIGKIMNPLTYIAIAFPDKYIDIGFSVMVIVTQYIAGLNFIFFAREVELGRNQQIIGGISYAFCGWLIVVSTNQGMLDIGAAVLPLLILGTEKIIKEKSPLLFIISVAYILTCNFFMAYISAIFVIMFFIVRYIQVKNDKTIGDFVKSAVRFMGYGIVGMMTGGIGLAYSLLKMTGATTESTVEHHILFKLKDYLQVPSAFFSIHPILNTYSYFYIPVICIILAPFIIKKIRKSTPALISIVFFIAVMFPVTGRFFNGLSYSTSRWYYGAIFFMVWATMELMNEGIFKSKANLKKMVVWICALGAWNIIVCHFLLDILPDDISGACIVGEVFGLILILLYYIREFRVQGNISFGFSAERLMDLVIVVVLIGSITGAANMRFYPGMTDFMFEESKAGATYDRLGSSTQRVVQDLQSEDKSFFRTDQVDGIGDIRYVRVKTNEAIYFGNRSIQTYISTMDSSWHKFNRTMGNNAGYFDRTTSYSNDNRPGLDLLMGVKYFLGDDQTKTPGAAKYAPYGFDYCKTIDGIDILQNKYDIGMGTMYTKYITESELEQYTYLEREQAILQAAVVPDEEAGNMTGIKHAAESDIKTNIKKIEYAVSDEDNIDMDADGAFTVYNDSGNFAIEIPEVKNCQIVISFSNLVREKSDYRDNLKLKGKDINEVNKNRLAAFVAEKSYEDNEKFDITLSKDGFEKKARNRKGKNQGFGDVVDFNINLGYFDSIGGKIGVNINRSGHYTYDSMTVYAIPMDIYNSSAELLEENRINVKSFENDRIEASVDVKQDSIMYLSILDNPDWKIYVDGKKVDKIDSVNISFTGALIEKGKHDIELRYSPGEMWLGLGLMAAGIAVTIVICLTRRRKGK